MSTEQHPPLAPVNGRPEGMSFEAYKELQRQQDQALRRHKRGQLIHQASGPKLLSTQDGRQVVAQIRSTYVKPKNNPDQ